MRGIMILTGETDYWETANALVRRQWLFIALAVLFFVLSILLFLKFHLKNYIFTILKQKPRNKGIAKAKRKHRIPAKKQEAPTGSEATQQLAVPKTELLVEDENKTEVLGDQELQFTIATNVEVYTQLLSENSDEVELT